MKRILDFMKPYVKESIFAPLFKMLEAILELFVPLVVADIIDKGIGDGDNGYIVKMVMLLLGLAIIGLVCSVTAQYFAAKAAVGAATNMRYSLFRHIQSLGCTELDRTGTETLITRMTSDINQVQNGINMVLRLFLRSPFIVFGAMIMAFTIDAKCALVFVFAIILLSAVVFGVMFFTRPKYRKAQSVLDKILGITRENLTGARVIRAFNCEENEVREFRENNEKLTVIQKLAGKISGLSNPLTFVIINFAVIALVYTGAIKVNLGSLSQGNVVALYNLMSQILVELVKLANLIVSITKAMACANRIDDLFRLESTDTEGCENEGTENAPSVSFRNVSFAYSGAGDEAVSDLSFTVQKGQTVGIIGSTGSGKSTLLNLMPRFYKCQSGEVLIEGRNILQYTDRFLREKIAVVPQKAQLFKGTIRDNLTIGRRDATDEDIEKALEVSQSKEFVDKKENRLEYMIEQGGKNLSGGQRQRLTIARALVMKPDILIMDDSASALDLVTDARLREALKTLDNSPTVFIASQRTSSIMHADMIIVMDDGKIAGAGTHDELLKTCEVYREIYDSQFKKEA